VEFWILHPQYQLIYWKMYGNNAALCAVSCFSSTKGDSARRFIEDLEYSFDIDSVTEDKYKKFYFKTKLRGLPAEWFETIRDENAYLEWAAVKSAFLTQFDKTMVRPKDVIAKLMKIRQNADEEESVQSFAIRITLLFKEYKEVTGKALEESEKIEYFIDSLYPALKEQLNNQYEKPDGKGYMDSTLKFDDVLKTAEKLERNARRCEEEEEATITDGISTLQINAVHKVANPKINPKAKAEKAVAEKEESTTLASIVEQNCNDIQELKRDQQAIRDQMSAMTQAIQNIGGEIRQIKVGIENLRYERVDCPGTVNPTDRSQRYVDNNGGANNNRIGNYSKFGSSFSRRFVDPRLYNPQRNANGNLSAITCYKLKRDDFRHET
jgi:hypothetical protein